MFSTWSFKQVPVYTPLPWKWVFMGTRLQAKHWVFLLPNWVNALLPYFPVEELVVAGRLLSAWHLKAVLSLIKQECASWQAFITGCFCVLTYAWLSVGGSWTKVSCELLLCRLLWYTTLLSGVFFSKSCILVFCCLFFSFRKVKGIYGGWGSFSALEKQLCSIGSLVFGAVTKQWKKLE